MTRRIGRSHYLCWYIDFNVEDGTHFMLQPLDNSRLAFFSFEEKAFCF